MPLSEASDGPKSPSGAFFCPGPSTVEIPFALPRLPCYDGHMENLEPADTSLRAERVKATAALARRLEAAASAAFVGSPRAVQLAVLALLSGLHSLVEDIPGVGKTTLALALSKAAGLSFSRIQFSPDLLPGDVLGMNVWDSAAREFVFKSGPINANFVLADEMNRASPRTQAAFLEAMQEGGTTIDGKTVSLPSPFFLLATQNPQGFAGTFPLPEAELDRFGLSFSLGYPSAGDEAEILRRWKEEGPLAAVVPVARAEDIQDARGTIASVAVSAKLREYIVQIVRATRGNPDIRLGASPRATVSLQAAARAVAAARGRSYAIPEDVEYIAPSALAHRLFLSSRARLSGSDAVALVAALAAAVPKPTGL